jgi:GTP-binding protein HflX
VPEERAILAGLDLKRPRRALSVDAGYTPEESLEELGALARTAGAQVTETILQTRTSPDHATLIGSGKVDALAGLVRLQDADVVIFDQDLTPTQQRNLEHQLDCRVIDRTQLILDIFAQRAHTREGQLQVELAQLNYLLPRLAGRGVQMSRLGGGIGTRGPGETQLETDRRRIFRRIRKIESDLEKVRAGRSTQRRQRRAVPLPTVALVGYTNAGKSTLFNRLTGSEVTADARLFATLDPTVRSISLPSRRRALLSDTVGFIRSLPTTLIEAFRATLEEVTEAALLLHVVDVSSTHVPAQMAQVEHVLKEIGAHETPTIVVLNKMDLVPGGVAPTQVHGACSVTVSARTSEGIQDLFAAIDRTLPAEPVSRERFTIALSDVALVHLVHELGRVVSERFTAESCEIEADVPESLKTRLAQYLTPPRGV